MYQVQGGVSHLRQISDWLKTVLYLTNVFNDMVMTCLKLTKTGTPALKITLVIFEMRDSIPKQRPRRASPHANLEFENLSTAPAVTMVVAILMAFSFLRFTSTLFDC